MAFKSNEIKKREGVSLCMLTKNEEVNPAGGIASFLDYHLPMVDEAVIVDTGSTDRTVEVAQTYNSPERQVVVIRYEWNGSFSDARNYGLRIAQFDHILVLDADERLLMPKESIRGLLPTSDGKILGYEFPFVDVLPDGLERINDNHPDKIDNYDHRIRYFQSLPNLGFRGTAHEQLTDIIGGLGAEGDVIRRHKQSPYIVKHFLPSEEVLREKENFYRTLIEEAHSRRVA